MSEWISRVCAKQKTFYVPPLSHSKSSQKSNKAINRTNSYKNVLVVVVLCIIYPNTPLTMSIFFSVLAGKKIQNVHFGILRHRHILLFTRRERIPHLMDLLSKRFASHIFAVTNLDIIWKELTNFFLSHHLAGSTVLIGEETYGQIFAILTQVNIQCMTKFELISVKCKLLNPRKVHI